MAAALEDKMTLTFRNEMNEMKNMMKALVPTPALIKAVEESELKCKALADLGASINLMPLSVYTKLGLPALQSTRMTLELANCSLCVPKGIARDVLVPWKNELSRRLCCKMSLRTDEERLIISVRSEELKYTTRPHKESVCMIDIFSSPKEKDEDSNAIFTSSEVVKCDFLTTNGDPITPPFTIPTKKDLTNEKVEKHETFLEKNEDLKRKTLVFSNPSSSLEKKEVEGEKTLDVKTIVSFFAPIGNCVRKWATNEFVKDNDEINHEVFFKK
ncbi:reverse transcriptase domain-containing protein [Tanacetum coccineum]